MKKKVIKYPILALFALFFLFSFVSNSEDGVSQKRDLHVIMFNISSELTDAEAGAIDAKMSAKDGIFVSRTNPDNSIYYCLSELDKNLTEATFRSWFDELGYKISCFDKVVQGEGTSKTFEELKKCAE